MELKNEHGETNDSKEIIDYLSSNRYLKTYISLSRENARPVSLGLRRSISFEHKINDNENNLDKTSGENVNLSLCSNILRSSLNNLCFNLRPYQLLPEYNKNIKESDDEHKFDWWNTIDHLRPLIENIILDEKLFNYFEDDLNNEQDQILIQFQKSKRNKRRNAICFAIDRLFYHEQMILFVAITNEIQIEFNLMSSGFKI